MFRAPALFLAALLTSCGDTSVVTIGPSSTTGAESEATHATALATTTSAQSSGVSSDGTAPGSGDTTGDDDDWDVSGFIEKADGDSPLCNIWVQDCPAGEKCAPYSSTGVGWDSTWCTPVDPDPADVGEPCTVSGSIIAGIDDCAVGSMCWIVDPETNAGTCLALCAGTPESPVCVDPETSCSISHNGALILCLPTCEPLAQDCIAGQACYPVGASFFCASDVSADDGGGYGDPCQYINQCKPGLFCAEPETVPNCDSPFGCCSEFCSLSHADGDTQCAGADDGQVCAPWFAPGQTPPGADDIGACIGPG